MKKVLLIFTLALVTVSVFAQKSDLRVLYVGIDPASPQKAVKGRNELPTQFETRLLRWNEFKSFLAQEFKVFKQLDRLEYNAAMSDDYDVTIFDARPKVLKERIWESDGKGGVKRYEPAAYLPDKFSAAALSINQLSSNLGEAIGTKLDWA